MINNKTIGLVDADSLCFFSSKETLEESKEHLDLYVKNISKVTKLKKFIFFISEGKYFRHSIYPQYKDGRPPSKLLYLKELKQYLKEKYVAYSFNGVEADDLVSYYSNKLESSVVIAIDKDLLKQIPGKHFNYYHKTFSFVETSKEESSVFLWTQVLMGDSTDNIKGIPGIGEKKAASMLLEAKNDVEMQAVVFKAYLEYYKIPSLAIHHMQLNFKLVYLLKTEEDFLLYGEELPKITQICNL